ncbi:2-succinylbenzoate-CoA ligase [Leptolyngbya valderiana BDU 20041]|nr:2-succinylbenzoate-CoA ligase [Leptolyngbya valderiana BDU 20041]
MMVDPLTLFQQRREGFELVAEGSDRFAEIVDRTLAELQSFQTTQPTPTVLLCEAEPVVFLAKFLAACIANVPLFLGNPNWRDTEWQQVRKIADFDGVWGTTAVSATPSRKNREIHPGIAIPTGGSSGKIRFAVHTWETLCASVFGFQQQFHLERINCCCTLPLFHVSGLMQFMRSLVTGGTLAICSSKAIESETFPNLEPETFWISLVPTQLNRLLNSPKTATWLSCFQGVLLGGAPAWQSLLETAKQFEIPVALTYGMTETASQVVTLHPHEFLKGNFSSGRVLPHAEVSILDELGNPLPPGEIGRVTIRSQSLMLGYSPLGKIERLQRLDTDDIGYFDENGFLHLLGRDSQKIITGGENVFPIEVENAVRSTGFVEDICVVGIPDSDWGEIVTAVYVARIEIISQNIKKELKKLLSSYKHPKKWIRVEQLPRNNRGKVNFQEVKRLAMAENDKS